MLSRAVLRLACAATLGPDLARRPLARMELASGLVLSCARCECGWVLTLNPTLEEGKLGEAFTDMNIYSCESLPVWRSFAPLDELKRQKPLESGFC